MGPLKEDFLEENCLILYSRLVHTCTVFCDLDCMLYSLKAVDKNANTNTKQNIIYSFVLELGHFLLVKQLRAT